jgi:hypothetical protein
MSSAYTRARLVTPNPFRLYRWHTIMNRTNTRLRA